jgi:hypothetical protein
VVGRDVTPIADGARAAVPIAHVDATVSHPLAEQVLPTAPYRQAPRPSSARNCANSSCSRVRNRSIR